MILTLCRRANLLLGIVEDDLDFTKLKAGKLDIEADINEALELKSQQITVPAGLESKLVISQHVGAPLGVRQMRQTNGGGGLKA